MLAVMFGWVTDDSDVEAITAGDLPGALVEDEAWMGAYFQGRKLGTFHSRTRKVAGGFRLEQDSRLRFRLAGSHQDVVTSLEVFLGDGFLLKSFQFVLQTGFLSVAMMGRSAGDKLKLELHIGDEVRRLEWSLDEPPMFDLAAYRVLARRDLKPGQRYRLTMFDPRTLSNQPAEIEVVGAEPVSIAGVLRSAVHLRRSVGGHRVDTWIDKRGGILEEKWEMGLTLRLEEEAVARAPADGFESGLEDEEVEAFRTLMPGILGDVRAPRSREGKQP
jgi:hypothetical protein